MTTNFFQLSLLLLFLVPGSLIRDPGSGMGKNQDPGSGINIPDPQHWHQLQDELRIILNCNIFTKDVMGI
jgi:hypothetical protein